MKTTNRFFTAIAVLLLLFNTSIVLSQSEEQKSPEYITATTFHWNMDYKDFNMDTWKSVEKEYLEKVIKKNEYIMGYSVYLHYFTPDNTEIVFVNAYGSWDDIDRASERSNELVKEAWPDDDSAKDFFQKRNAYYANTHSDEIYATMAGAKLMATVPDKDMITYVRTSHFAFPKDGTGKEFQELRKESTEALINKNEYIKAYYPNAHAWGSDRTQFVEAFFVDSLADLDKMFDRMGELAKEAWPDEEARKARGEKFSKYFTGVHGDAIYKNIHELTK